MTRRGDYDDDPYIRGRGDEYMMDRQTAQPPQAGIVRVEADPMGTTITPGERASEEERQAYRDLLEQCRKLGYLSDGECSARLAHMDGASKTKLQALTRDLPSQPELRIAGSQRTSQVERDRILDHLARCHADGRLSDTELDRRTDYIHTHAGVTEKRLLELIKDLPPLVPPEEERTLWGMFPKSPQALHAMLNGMRWSQVGPRARVVFYIASTFFGILLLAGSIAALSTGHGLPVIGDILGIAGIIAGVAWAIASIFLVITDESVNEKWS